MSHFATLYITSAWNLPHPPSPPFVLLGSPQSVRCLTLFFQHLALLSVVWPLSPQLNSESFKSRVHARFTSQQSVSCRKFLIHISGRGGERHLLLEWWFLTEGGEDKNHAPQEIPRSIWRHIWLSHNWEMLGHLMGSR